MGGGASKNSLKDSATHNKHVLSVVKDTSTQKEENECIVVKKERKPPDIVNREGIATENPTTLQKAANDSNFVKVGFAIADENEFTCCDHGSSNSTSSEIHNRQTGAIETSSLQSNVSPAIVSVSKLGARSENSRETNRDAQLLTGSQLREVTRPIDPSEALTGNPSVQSTERADDAHSKFLPFASPVKFAGGGGPNDRITFPSSELSSTSAAIQLAAQIAASIHFAAIDVPESSSTIQHTPGAMLPPQITGGVVVSAAPPKPKGPTSTPQKSRSPSFTVPLPSTPQRSRSPSFTLPVRSRTPSFIISQRSQSPSFSGDPDSPRRMRPPGPGYIRPPDTNHTARSFHYNSSRPSSVFTDAGAPTRGVAAGPHPPGQFSTTGSRPKSSNHNNLDPNRRLLNRPFPSNVLDKERNMFSYDDDEQYSAVFTDPAKAEPMSAKPSVIPPLHLNSNLNGNLSLSFPTAHQNYSTSRQHSPAPIRGVGTASPALRVNTNSSQMNLMVSVASGLMARTSGQHSTVSSARGIGNGMNTPNGIGTTRSMAPPGSAASYEVKETNDVKRNRAKLPPTMIHAKPTTGDWLKKRYIVNNYILLDTLGTGSYGEVRLCKDRTTDHLFAIKIISKEMLKKRKSGNTTETYFEDIRREIAIMKKLLHPNVLRLYEVLDDPNVNKMYLVLEYMKKGDLINVLQEREMCTLNSNSNGTGTSPIPGVSQSQSQSSLSDIELWNIFRQVVAGIRYLHYQNVVHGDIKPQNLLVGENGIVKIADFGISKMLSNSGEQLGNAAGTPAFMSPELCAAEAFSGQLADVWALGATIFMLKYGHPPFVAGNLLSLYNKIQNDPLVFPVHMKINPGLQDLLGNMLIKDPNERFTLHKVIVHPWLRYAPVVSTCTTAVTSPEKSSVCSTLHGTTFNNNNNNNSRNSAKNSLKFANSRTTNNNVHFTPPESYDLEEAAAMEVPLKAVNMEDMYKSIGVSLVGKNKKVKTRRRNLSKEFNSYNTNERILKGDGEEDEEGEEENMMVSGWGADVFEIVGEADSAGSDSDYDDDDDDDDVDDKTNTAPHTATSTICGKYVSASGSSTGSVVDIVDTSPTLNVFHNTVDPDSSDDELSITVTAPAETTSEIFQNQVPRSVDEIKDPMVPLTISTDSKESKSDDQVVRRSMGAAEESVRSNRFRSQLSKKCMKDQNSKKNVLEALCSEQSSCVTSPLVHTPTSVTFPSKPSCMPFTLRSGTPPNKMNLWQKDKDSLKSADGDDDIDFTGELSMEEFSVLMDTLAMQPKKNMLDITNGNDIIHPIEVILQTSCLNSKLRNKFNGVGIASYSEKGLRDDQEDRCCLVPDAYEIHLKKGHRHGTGLSTDGDVASDEDILHKITVACLFDGHSGSVCSEYMSKHFASMLVHHDKFLDKSPESALLDVCRCIDGKVCDYLIEDDDLSGSTGVVVVYDGRRNVLTVANVGDSMCILSRGGVAVNMHCMHRLDNEKERARVVAAGGTVIKNRVNGVLAVSRAFGDTRFKNTNSWRDSHTGESKGPVIAVPDIYSEVCTPLTEFCIIATDGLWDVMSPQLAVNFVRTKMSMKCDLQKCVKELVLDALKNGGSVDNVTVVLLSFHMPVGEI